MPTPTTKPKRRLRLRWSMRTMFVGITIFCVWFGMLSQRAKEQKRAVEALRKFNGGPVKGTNLVKRIARTSSYGFEIRGLNNYSTHRIPEAEYSPPGPAWLRDLIGIDYFADVVQVFVAGPNIHDDDLRQLQSFSKLKKLELLDCDLISDAGLEHLKCLEELQWLSIRGTNVITKKGVADLRRALPYCSIYVIYPVD